MLMTVVSKCDQLIKSVLIYCDGHERPGPGMDRSGHAPVTPTFTVTEHGPVDVVAPATPLHYLERVGAVARFMIGHGGR